MSGAETDNKSARPKCHGVWAKDNTDECRTNVGLKCELIWMEIIWMLWTIPISQIVPYFLKHWWKLSDWSCKEETKCFDPYFRFADWSMNEMCNSEWVQSQGQSSKPFKCERRERWRVGLDRRCALFVPINMTGAAKKRLIHGRNRSSSEGPTTQPVRSAAQLMCFLSVGKFQCCSGSHVVVVWVRGTVMRLWRKREEIAKASCTTVLLYHFQVDTRQQTRPLRLGPGRRKRYNSTTQRLREVLYLGSLNPFSFRKSRM